MIKTIADRKIKLKWMGANPGQTKKAALLIPQFNESRNCNFVSRLEYFNEVAEKFGKELDVILIDDGSTDNSLTVMESFQQEYNASFYIASVYPNADKVGALFVTTLSVSHELIILSDFDTDILGLEDVISSLDFFQNDPSLMGGYFRMLPFEGEGPVFDFQRLEYTLLRSLYKFQEKERSVSVMPGAGSCYKREILISIYHNHSGLRSGEDREATLIGLKLGYKTFYLDRILTLTRPPLSLSALIKQRIRWNLGYLETINKEKKYYCTQIARLSRVGLRTVGDFIIVFCTIALPVLIIWLSFINPLFSLWLFLGIYLGGICWSLNLLFISPAESRELKEKLTLSILLYPAIKLTLDYLAWTGAILTFMKKLISKDYKLQGLPG